MEYNEKIVIIKKSIANMLCNNSNFSTENAVRPNRKIAGICQLFVEKRKYEVAALVIIKRGCQSVIQ
jgi:hypothetical protein